MTNHHTPKPQGVLKYGWTHGTHILVLSMMRGERHAKCDGFGETIGSNPIGFGNHLNPLLWEYKSNHLRKATFTLSSIFYKIMKSHAIKT
jgi:hypothetical protein